MPATEAIDTVDNIAMNPSGLVIHGDTVWVGDWSSPALTRVPAVGSGGPKRIPLRVPVGQRGERGLGRGRGRVWCLGCYAQVRLHLEDRSEDQRCHADPLLHLPSFVAVDDGAVW